MDLQTLLFGAGKLVDAYGAKRQGDFDQRVQLMDLQQQSDRAWQMRNAIEAQNAALIDGMNQANEVWGDYYGQYQADLPQFSPEAKEAGLADSIASAVGRQTQAVQEGHSADMGGGIEGRVSADYEGGLEGAASGSLARALNRAKLRGTVTGFNDDKLREGNLVGDMGFNAQQARQDAQDAQQLAGINAQIAGYLPPEEQQLIPGYDNTYATIGQLLMTGGNLYGQRQEKNALGDAAGTIYPNYQPPGFEAKHGGDWYLPKSWAEVS